MSQLAEDCYFTLLGTGKDGEKYNTLRNVTIIEEYDKQLFWVTDLDEYQLKQSKIVTEQLKEIDQ